MQGRRNLPPAASFANCVMTLYLLQVHFQTFLSIPITQKRQILNCDTLVTKERYFAYMCYTLYIAGILYIITEWIINIIIHKLAKNVSSSTIERTSVDSKTCIIFHLFLILLYPFSVKITVEFKQLHKILALYLNVSAYIAYR